MIEQWEATKGYGLDMGYFFKILPIKLVHSVYGAPFILFCTVNCLDMDGINFENFEIEG